MSETIYPVIMCGGAGTRLWPASRPSLPKQFIGLIGPHTLFQQTALRVAPLAGNTGRLIVIGGVRQRDSIRDQLAAAGLDAVVLLEPTARDSAPAMAAAAAWVARHDPDGVLAIIASDHHIPDDDAFQQAVRTAAHAAATQGRIVTLGVAPVEPSSAYGYIKPSGPGLSAVDAFVEKPDRETAAAYVAQGYLWNSGNFIVSARTLIAELDQFAPAVLAAATAALPAAPRPADGPSRDGDAADPHPMGSRSLGPYVLGDVFAEAPSTSIDYAVMEKTRLASVLAVDFDWSDLGAWDAVAATGQGGMGVHAIEDVEGCLIRAPEGVVVAALGVRNLAIVVERDAVLVCDLSRSQDVKRIVERVRSASPGHLDLPAAPVDPLPVSALRFADWLRLRALPTWATLGLGSDGAFAEALNPDGRPVPRARRARVQTRQTYVYAQAGLLGWQGPWRAAVESGLTALRRDFARPDGLCRTLVGQDGTPLDDTVMVYDQAFALLALATAKQAGIADHGLDAWADAIRDGLLARPAPHGGVREAGDHPFQANAHMHLLEACLAWDAATGDGSDAWRVLADQIVGLALDRFIDPAGGYLREFFTEDWSPAAGADGRLVEPGHQFEWVWLLTVYGRRPTAAPALKARIPAAAARLYAAGRGGVSSAPAFALDALTDTFDVARASSRLWPQTEWLKASLILSETAEGEDRARLLDDAAQALRALRAYLTPDGVWRDTHLENGGFVDEPAPASSLYHIMVAFLQLSRTGAGVEGLAALDLR